MNVVAMNAAGLSNSTGKKSVHATRKTYQLLFCNYTESELYGITNLAEAHSQAVPSSYSPSPSHLSGLNSRPEVVGSPG